MQGAASLHVVSVLPTFGCPCISAWFRDSCAPVSHYREQEMTYSVTDIAELVRHHLVLSESNDERATENLRRLSAEIRQMAPSALETTAEWLFCDRCGATVDLAVLAVDGSNFTPGGGFYCSDECAR